MGSDTHPVRLFAQDKKVQHSSTALRNVLADISRAGYRCSSKIVASYDYCVPQNRVRTYVVGLRADASMAAFRFPAEFGATLNLTVSDILRPLDGDDDPARRPRAQVARGIPQSVDQCEKCCFEEAHH